jgi:hypothetical protein
MTVIVTHPLSACDAKDASIGNDILVYLLLVVLRSSKRKSTVTIGRIDDVGEYDQSWQQQPGLAGSPDRSLFQVASYRLESAYVLLQRVGGSDAGNLNPNLS